MIHQNTSRLSPGVTVNLSLILIFFLNALNFFGQPPSATETIPEGQIPTTKTTREPAQHLPFSVGNIGIGYPIACDVNDSRVAFPAITFTPEGDGVRNFSIYSIDLGDSLRVRRYDPGLSGLHQISPSSWFAISSSRVILKVTALTPQEELNGSSKNPHPFLLFFGKEGNFLRATPLNLPFEIGGVGVFDSGNLLIVSSSTATSQWTVLSEDGEIVRRLIPTSSETPPSEKTTLVSALHANKGLLQILPWNHHLLILEMNSVSPILEITEQGILRTTSLKVPKEMYLGRFIPTDGKTWKVALGHVVDKDSAETGLRAGHFFMDKVAEFDSSSGELIRYIDVTDSTHYAAAIACEKTGSYFFLSADPKGKDLLIEESKVIR